MATISCWIHDRFREGYDVPALLKWTSCLGRDSDALFKRLLQSVMIRIGKSVSTFPVLLEKLVHAG